MASDDTRIQVSVVGWYTVRVTINITHIIDLCDLSEVCPHLAQPRWSEGKKRWLVLPKRMDRTGAGIEVIE